MQRSALLVAMLLLVVAGAGFADGGDALLSIPPVAKVVASSLLLFLDLIPFPVESTAKP